MPAEITNRRIIARFGLAYLFYGLLLFGPAGTLNWPEAWLFLILYMGWAVVVLGWLKKNNPSLLEERMKFLKKPAKCWDKALMISLTILFIITFLTIGLDFRYKWSSIPIALKALGFALSIPALVLIFRVMRENTYLSRIVEVQKGQKVISTGPYKYVRHPMYAGVIALFLCVPLALGSLYALIPSALMAAGIIIRTHLEDRTLQKELPGYLEYAKKTRYRLVPGVW